MNSADNITRTLLGQQGIPEDTILTVKKFIQSYAQERCKEQRMMCTKAAIRWFEKICEKTGKNKNAVGPDELQDLVNDLVASLEPYYN